MIKEKREEINEAIRELMKKFEIDEMLFLIVPFNEDTTEIKYIERQGMSRRKLSELYREISKGLED